MPLSLELSLDPYLVSSDAHVTVAFLDPSQEAYHVNMTAAIIGDSCLTPKISLEVWLNVAISELNAGKMKAAFTAAEGVLKKARLDPLHPQFKRAAATANEILRRAGHALKEL